MIGIVPFAVFVGAGALAARLLARRLGRRWPLVVPAFVAVAVVVGTLYLDGRESRPRRGTRAGRLGPPCWMACRCGCPPRRRPRPASGSRGFDRPAPRRGRPGTRADRDRRHGRRATVSGVLPGRAPGRGRRLRRLRHGGARTRPDSPTIGHDGGFDWRRNPAWIGLVLVVLAVAITATVALTTVGASLIQVLAGVTVGVLVIVALSAGLERGALKLAIGLIVFQLAIYLLVAGLRPGGPVPELPASGSGYGSGTDASRVLTLGVGGVVLLAAVVAIVVLATIWMRRTRTPIEDPVHESRTIDRGALTDTPGTARRRQPTSPPRAARRDRRLCRPHGRSRPSSTRAPRRRRDARRTRIPASCRRASRAHARSARRRLRPRPLRRQGPVSA